jgi:hypothetical protein
MREAGESSSMSIATILSGAPVICKSAWHEIFKWGVLVVV